MSAAEATTIFDVATLAFEARHALAHAAVVHRTDDVQVSVYVLEPGGRVPAHRHSAAWDISFVFEGEIEARFIEGDRVRIVRCGAHAINLVPPGAVHEIANASATRPAKFLLIQSPSRDFDFIKCEPPALA